MKKVNALTLRQSLGKVLRDLARNEGPILVEKGREPAAVLISVKDFRERFVDKHAAEERKTLVEHMIALRKRKGKSNTSSLDILRSLRGPLP